MPEGAADAARGEKQSLDSSSSSWYPKMKHKVVMHTLKNGKDGRASQPNLARPAAQPATSNFGTATATANPAKWVL